MLISHRKKFIYTKTVKTAGTSIEVYFEPYCMPEGEWTFQDGRLEYISETGIIGCRTGNPIIIQGSTWWNHMPAVAIRALIGSEIWDSYFKFCAVRNPFDKLVSAYHFFGPCKADPANPDAPSLQDDFERWLTAGPLPIDRNKYVIDGQFCMDDVIRYENLPEDIERICRKLDIPFRPAELLELKKRTTPRTPLKNYYSPRSLEFVQEKFGFELEKFGYSAPA